MTSPQRKRTVLAALSLLGLTLVAYVPALQAGFIWDDDYYVTENRTLRSLGGLRQIWFEVGATPQYYPLVHTSYWLEYRLGGPDPAGYHLVNVLLHALAAVLVWRVLTALGLPGAWATAALFAVHPVHVESVAWITERKNVLSGVFYLAAALVHLRYAAGGTSRGRSAALYLLSLTLFVCALLSKTVTATLPAALLLILWWKRGRLGRAEVLPLAPFFAPAVGLGLLTIYMERHIVGATGSEWTLSFLERCLIAGRALWFYAGKLVWPAELIFVYPRWQVSAASAGQFIFPAAAIALVVALWFLRGRLGRGPLVAVLFFAGTLVPALGFFDVYPMRYSFVADHFQYLASLGPIALAAALGARAFRRLEGSGRKLAAACLAVLLVAGGLLTWRHARAFDGLESLWRDTLDKNPRAWMAHNNLGVLLHGQGRIEEAIGHYREALELKPDHAQAHNNLGSALRAAGEHERAEASFRRALRIDPDYGEAHFNLGNTFREQGRLEEAVGEYELALRIDPSLGQAHYRLGLVLLDLGRYDQAARRLADSIRSDPSNAEAHFNHGVALWSAGHVKAALESFQRALEVRPDWTVPMASAAWIRATHQDPRVRDPALALRLARRAAELTGRRDAEILDTLAAAHAAAGRFDLAVAAARQAVELARSAGLYEQADEYRARLELYLGSTPYLEPAAGSDAIE